MHKLFPYFAEMYIPEPTNIPIEKTNHRGKKEHDSSQWPTPSENDILHHRGKYLMLPTTI